MRRITNGILGATALVAAGCGSGGSFANHPRPATPVNLTVYVDNARVSVSPTSVGAGPIVFIVTNQASRSESLQIQPQGGSGALADTGPINPQGTAEVKVDVRAGEYRVATSSGAASDASAAITAPIRPARIHVGPARPSAKDALLQP